MLLLGLIVVIAAVLRARWNDVRSYSRADESTMLELARAWALPRYDYRAACERWLARPELYCTPSPVRFGNLALLSLAFRLIGKAKHRSMAWVSTVAGVVQVAAVAGIARLLDVPAAGVAMAAALATTSALGLAMSRRALQDAAVSATLLGATWALLAGHPVAGAALVAFLLAQKETAGLLLPAVGALCWAAGRPCWLALGVGPLLYVAAFSALTRRPLLLWRFARAISSIGAHPYALDHQSGPLHRLVLDLLALGPVTVLVACRSAQAIPALLGAALVLLALGATPATKNVRIALPADGLLRVVAGAELAHWGAWGVVVLAVGCVSDLWIFRRVFLTGGVYDPVTANLTAALGMAPHGTR